MNPVSPTAIPASAFLVESNTAPVLQGHPHLYLPDFRGEVLEEITESLELVWVAPTHRPFAQYNFQKELFITATMFHRKFFTQNNTDIPDELYQPRLSAFKDAFEEWTRNKYGKGKWSVCFHRDELVLSFDKTAYNSHNIWVFYATPTYEKYNSGQTYQRSYQFQIESQSEIEIRADAYVEDNICYFTSHSIINNLKEGAVKEPFALDYAELADNHKTEKDFNEEECPCCFEPLKDDPIVEGGFLGKCGHCVCVGCLKGLVKSQHSNLVCPMCRDDWECYNVSNIEEGEEYTLDDIDEMKSNEEWEKLLEIVDIAGLREHIATYNGYDDILGEEQGYQVQDGLFYYSIDEYAITYPDHIVPEVY